MRAKVKICGITNSDDALFCRGKRSGRAGFCFLEEKPEVRGACFVKAIVKALPPFVSCVGVFVDEEASRVNGIARQAGLSCVQLHGSETPEFCRGMELRVIKAFRIKVTLLRAVHQGGAGSGGLSKATISRLFPVTMFRRFCSIVIPKARPEELARSLIGTAP